MNRLPVRSPYGRLWSLQRAVDRLFDDAFYRAGAGEADEGQPALDMFETEDAVVVKAAVPGFSPDDIDVSITGNTLTIKGQVSAEEDKEEQNYIFRERHMASFSRMLTLPHEVGAKATAQFENGVLTLTLPKPEEVKPKTIQVKVK
jgi:HSP20 family protein